MLQRQEEIVRREQRAESYMTDDAEMVLVAFGLVSRLCKYAVNKLRENGVRAGLYRPITLSSVPVRWTGKARGKRGQEVPRS